MPRFTFAACVLLLCILHAHAIPLSSWTTGTASFFGGPQDSSSNAYKLTIDSGSCGYGDFDPRLYPFYNVVSLHKSNPIVANRPMDACGSCLEIQCIGKGEKCNSRRRIQTVITDQCAENCDSTNVNIHVFGFEQIAPPRIGRTQVRYRLVECQPADPVIIHIMDHRATEGGWIRLALKNVAGDAALISVEIAASSKDDESPQAWMPCKNTYGAVWEAGIGGVALPTPPLDLRITNGLLQQVVIKKFVAIAGTVGDVETTAQFPSPFGDSGNSSSNAPMNSQEEEPFVLPIPKGNPTVTLGMAIIRPTNTLFGPPMNATHGAIHAAEASENYIDHSNLDTPANSNLDAPANSKQDVPVPGNQNVPVNGNPDASAATNTKKHAPAPSKQQTKSTPSNHELKPQLAPQAPVQASWRTAAPAATNTAPVQHTASPSPSPQGGMERGPSAGAQVYGILQDLASPVKPAGRTRSGRRLLLL